jgi:hypothetical protein
MYWEVSGRIYELDAGQTSGQTYGQTCVDFDLPSIARTVATRVFEHLPLLPNGEQATGPELYKFGAVGLTVTVITPGAPAHHWVVDGWGDCHVPSAREMAHICLELAWTGMAWDEVEAGSRSMFADDKLGPMYLEYQLLPNC